VSDHNTSKLVTFFKGLAKQRCQTLVRHSTDHFLKSVSGPVKMETALVLGELFCELLLPGNKINVKKSIFVWSTVLYRVIKNDCLSWQYN
jgi:hypothetical protein